jgi:hypothetical protein
MVALIGIIQSIREKSALPRNTRVPIAIKYEISIQIAEKSKFSLKRQNRAIVEIRQIGKIVALMKKFA